MLKLVGAELLISILNGFGSLICIEIECLSLVLLFARGSSCRFFSET